MSDVELVIKISKELYDLVQNKLDFNGDLDKQKVKALMLAIDNGVPFPKGHGKIGDLDRLYNVFEKNVVSADAFKELFDYAPTIIEADKAESEVQDAVSD